MNMKKMKAQTMKFQNQIGMAITLCTNCFDGSTQALAQKEKYSPHLEGFKATI